MFGNSPTPLVSQYDLASTLSERQRPLGVEPLRKNMLSALWQLTTNVRGTTCLSGNRLT